MSEDRPEPTIRPEVRLPQSEHAWITDYARSHGKSLTDLVRDMIHELQKHDTTDPVDVQRRKLFGELENVEEELRKLNDFEKNLKFKRYRYLFGMLTNEKDTRFPKGPYAGWGPDWKALNRKAVQDFREGAEWGKRLEVHGPVELDRSFDYALRVRATGLRKRELEAQLDALREKVVEPLGQETSQAA